MPRSAKLTQNVGPGWFKVMQGGGNWLC